MDLSYICVLFGYNSNGYITVLSDTNFRIFVLNSKESDYPSNLFESWFYLYDERIPKELVSEIECRLFL